MSQLLGINTLDVTDPQQEGCECDACGTRMQVVVVRCNWIHAGPLPLAPVGVSVQICCRNCAAAPRISQLSAAAAAYVRKENLAALRRLAWAFLPGTGMLITGLFCLCI